MMKRVAQAILSRPATEKYPAKKADVAENFRGQPILDSSSCIGCSLCCRNCPAKAITMVEVDGKKRPQFDLAACIFCYQCVDICPKKAIHQSSNFELATTDKASLIIKPKSPDQP
jgi:formate hydrogenlyase subunit 6/NADH:ubiquinone oxidoreductase subunit I